MRIPKDPILHASLLTRRRNVFEYTGEVISAYMGRYAVYRILNMLGIGASEEVLIPTYHCVAMVDPILRYGCGIGLYRVNAGLQTNVEDIKRGVGKRTRAVVLIHYFGLPQRRLEEIKEYLEREGVFLIEDCAHVIPREGDLSGSVGDVSFYTPRKFLPVPDGAIIRVNNRELMNRIRNSRLPIYNEIKALKNTCEKRLMSGERSLVKELYAKIDKRVIRIGKRGKTLGCVEKKGLGVEFDPKFIEAKCSLTAQYIMRVADFEEIYRKRVGVFQYLYETVYGRRMLEPLELLSQGNGGCTFGFPILSVERKRKIKLLKDRGIETFTFGETLYRSEELTEGSAEVNLSRNLFFAPITQDIDRRQMEYLAECLREVLGDSRQ